MKVCSQLAFSTGLLMAAITSASDTIFSIHGSGTSNPARCFGHVMEELQAQAKLPVRMTYRSIGSTKGVEEFINNMNLEQGAMDFGSGEIPLSTEQWQAFKDQNVTVLQMPALFGAVSFFHSVPDLPQLNLTSCLLSRIFLRDIKDWGHPDIRELNPGITEMFEREEFVKLGGSMAIRVAVREEGAGNTLAITQYLQKACPHHFPEDMVSSLPTWPDDTDKCRGTLGMNDCIKDRPGTIGFNEAGIGIFAGLQEISIKNKYGRLLNSQEAAANGGIGSEEKGILPAEPTGDFGAVSLLDQDGDWTWPITLLTYIYVRADLKFKSDEIERALLLTFLQAMYDPDYVQKCEESYGFFIPTEESLALAQKGLQILEDSFDTVKFTKETSVDSIVGAGDMIISTNRRNYPAVERDANLDNVNKLATTMQELEETVAMLKSQLANKDVGGDEAEFTAEYEAMILSSLILGAVALCVALSLSFYALSKKEPAK